MRYVVLAVAVAATGCQGAAQPPTDGSALGSVRSLTQAVVPAQRHDLLYVSAFNGPLYAFTYPQGKLVGQVTTSFGGAGICSDKQGNVYVNTPAAYTVYVFAHAGLIPVYELDEASEGANPYGCAVNRRTGDLAVTNLEGFVSVYKGARGTPQAYSLPGLYEAFFCAYDDKGNLFATGDDAGGRFALAELPAGSGTAKAVAVDASIAAGYGIAWNEKDLVLQSTAVRQRNSSKDQSKGIEGNRRRHDHVSGSRQRVSCAVRARRSHGRATRLKQHRRRLLGLSGRWLADEDAAKCWFRTDRRHNQPLKTTS